MKKDTVQNPHDLFFKKSWSNVTLVRSFLEEYLPSEMRVLIALDSLTICKNSFRDHRDVLGDAGLHRPDQPAQRSPDAGGPGGDEDVIAEILCLT